MDLTIIDRVECPTCYQRQHVELDCICCGGIGFVDSDRIEPTIAQTLADLESGIARSSKNTWLPIGLYPLRDGTWFVIDQLRNTRQISDEDVNAVLYIEEPFWLDSLLLCVETSISKLFGRVLSLVRKPIL